MITRPLLAYKIHTVEEAKFPCLATPKIDGIRCLKIKGKALSRSFKPIPNRYVRELVERYLPDGVDGELVLNTGKFNDCQSAFMRRSGEPDFTYKIFDYVKDSIDKPYEFRVQDMMYLQPATFVRFLNPTYLSDVSMLKTYEDKALAWDYEGVCMRTPESPYKCGRSTYREGYLIALKRFKRSEAMLTGFEPMYQNLNPAEADEFGNTKRASNWENKIQLSTLGVMLATDCNNGKQIRLGTGQGLTLELRKKIWNNQDKYLGKIITYQYQSHGMKDLPRILSFIGFRDPRDL